VSSLKSGSLCRACLLLDVRYWHLDGVIGLAIFVDS
jgi:hypothetical protein